MLKKILPASTLLILLIFGAHASAATPASRVMLVKTKSSSAVYAVVNNQRVPITSPADLAAKGYSWKNLKIITDKKMGAIPLASTVDQQVTAAQPVSVPAQTEAGPASPVVSSPVVQSLNTAVTAAVDNQGGATAATSYVRPTQMHITEIGMFDGTAQLFAINNQGQVVGSKSLTSSDTSNLIFFWDAGVTTIIPNAITPLALNNKGQVLFLATNPSGGETVGIWEAGKSVLFKGFDPTLYHVEDVIFGDDGIAYGTAHSGCSKGPEDSCVDYFKATKNGVTFLKSPGKKLGLPRTIKIPGTTEAYIQKLNSRGQGIGFANYKVGAENDFGQQTFFWNAGTATQLKGFNAVAINSEGDVVGNGSAGYTMFTYSEESQVPPDVLTTLKQTGPVIYWRDGRSVNLSQAVTDESGVQLFDVAGLNDRGQILARAWRPGSDLFAFVIVSIPQNFSPTFQFTRELGKYFTIRNENDAMKAWANLINSDREKNVYTIKWISDDTENPTTVSLYYDTDAAGADGTLIVSDIKQSAGHNDGVYVWNASAVRRQLFQQLKLDRQMPEGQPECKYVYDDAVRRENGAIQYSVDFTNCFTLPKTYYLYAVISDGVNPARVVYSKDSIEL